MKKTLKTHLGTSPANIKPAANTPAIAKFTIGTRDAKPAAAKGETVDKRLTNKAVAAQGAFAKKADVHARSLGKSSGSDKFGYAAGAAARLA